MLFYSHLLLMTISIFLGAMDFMLLKNQSVLFIGTVGIASGGFEKNKLSENIYNYEPEIKENLQIRNKFLNQTGLDIKKFPKSKPIPIPIK